MKHALFRWATLWLLLLATLRASENDVRFSQALNAEDRGAAGISRLTSDEVAVIDALVRRDTAARAGATNNDKAPASFSERLTADERRTAGLAKLSATELPKLDALVDRQQNARLARTLLAPPTYALRAARMNPTEKKKEREIHGSYSLSYGFGSGGYSEKSGSMVLSLEDPERGFSLSIGYSETHVKGGNGYIYRDPFYDPLRGYDPLRSYDPLRGPYDGIGSPLRP